jgi:D-alanyl-D-alanine carboxypeptidase
MPRGLARWSRVWLLLAATAVSCTDSGTEPPILPDAGPQELQRVLDSIVATIGVPGAIVGITSGDGQRLIFSSGVEDLATGAPFDLRDRFRVGSVTKTMISTVVLQLVDEGQLSLDDTLSKLLPVTVRNADVMTIRQLLNHISGVPNYTDDPAFISAILADPARVWTDAELVAVTNNRLPSFLPGANGRWEYSNTNYILLGMVIESIAGAPIGSILQSRIFGPLGMSSTFFPTTTDTPAPFSRGYYDLPGSPNADVASLLSPSTAGAAGAVVSNAEDLMVWSEALASGQLLSVKSHAQQVEVVAASGIAAYAMGAETFGHWIGHSGDVPGYETDMFTRPGVGTIVVLVNKTTQSGGSSRRIFDAMRWARFPFR